jgi:hypothetical protein
MQGSSATERDAQLIQEPLFEDVTLQRGEAVRNVVRVAINHLTFNDRRTVRPIAKSICHVYRDDVAELAGRPLFRAPDRVVQGIAPVESAEALGE